VESLVIRDLLVEFYSGDYLIRPLDGFAAEAHSGELVLLLGPSGCGKTTLLSCLAGILTPKSGSISVDGKDVTRFGARELTDYRRHGVGLVFQGFKLVPSLNALENVAVPLRLAGIDRTVARKRAEDLLGRFGLSERMRNRPGKLSGGQQQRVAIARALAHDPPLLLADEPTAALDYIQVETVIRTLRDLAQPGRIVIVSTHDHRLVPLADRVIKMGPETPISGSESGPVKLSAGSELFAQGTHGELIYVVESGEIDLVRARSEGVEELLHCSTPGEYFGELSPMLGFPRAATARARTEAVVVGYTVQQFRELVGPEGLRKAMGSHGPAEPTNTPAPVSFDGGF
jgi:putative ABC transport system ATP-binding protein